MDNNARKKLFRIKSLISSIAKPFEALSTTIRLVLLLPDDDLLIESDDMKIEQIVHALIDNAFKYTQRGAIIITVDYNLDSQVNQCELSISVHDTGIGIAGDEQPSMLRHVSVTTKNTNEPLSGLELCMQNLKEVNGSISFISKIGLGSKFIINFKCRYHPEAIKVVYEQQQVLLDEQSKSRYDNVQEIFKNSGQNGKFMAELDWSKTAIGPTYKWPQSLITSASICLKSRFPMLILWGPQFALLYNDGYSDLLGSKHPNAIGQPGLEVWNEVEGVIGPMLRGVMQYAGATWSEDQMLFLERNGFLEECYFTYSFSAIHDETGKIVGVFTVVFETTNNMLDKRRLNLLKEIARASLSKSSVDAYRHIGAALATCTADLPFGLLYRMENQRCELKASFGLAEDNKANIDVLVENSLWPYKEAIQGGESFLVEDLEERFGQMTCHLWPEPVTKAVILPIRLTVQSENLLGVLIVGISPRLAFNERYRSFLELVGDRVTNVLGAIQEYEAQRYRADELANLDKAKTQFFTNISHEFRTPLALMLGPLSDSLVDKEHPLDEVQCKRQQMIHNNALRLLKLVNNILDFSRVEHNRTQITFRPIDLCLTTQQLCSTFQSVLEQAGIEFILNLTPINQPVFVNVETWEKIVLNLLSNAFKFTLKGSITVNLIQVADRVQLSIIDTGVGIADEEQSRIFERFYRVENSGGRSFEGSGIGLALIKELVNIHGGSISFTSKVNQGTCFVVDIPLGNDHSSSSLNSEQYIPSKSAIAMKIEAEQWISERGSTTSKTLVTVPMAHNSPHVLIVDDNADMCDYIASILSPHYKLTMARDGQEALEMISVDMPDLIISDIMMPRLDGFSFVQRLQDNHLTNDIPIILLSARAGDDAKIEGLSRGIHELINVIFI
jgi:signal transduction histidine kinase